MRGLKYSNNSVSAFFRPKYFWKRSYGEIPYQFLLNGLPAVSYSHFNQMVALLNIVTSFAPAPDVLSIVQKPRGKP